MRARSPRPTRAPRLARGLLATTLLMTTPLLSSCATLRELMAEAVQEPTVTILGVHIRSMTLNNIATTFTVRLDNPNAFGLYLAGVEYQLDVDQVRLAQGATQDSVTLTPLGSTEATLDIDFPLGSLGVPLVELLQKDRVHYVLDTVFRVGAKQANVPIPARFEGDVDLPKAPTLEAVELTFPEVSIEGVQVKINAHVGNPNAFPIPIDELLVSFSFGGREILTNQQIAGVVLTEGQTTVVPLSFSVGLAELGLSVAELATRPELRWDLKMRLVSGNTILPYEREGQTLLLPTFDGAGVP